MSLHFTQIKETCLYISDLDAAWDFYHKKLGLPVISRVEGRHIFFRAGASVLLCFIAGATRNEENLPPHFASGNQHFAFECKAKDYKAWKELLQEKEITIEHEQDWKNGRQSAYFRDPDRHVVEIVQPGIWE
ncbi:MAG: VOC family protein [Bacteroidia bacterium]